MIKVTDVYLNGWLRAKGFKGVSNEVELVDGRKRVTFLYDEDPELEVAIKEFREDEFTRRFITEYLYSKRMITEALYGEGRGY